MVSCIFTCPPTSTPSSPRWPRGASGSMPVPLLCAQEIAVSGALPRIIRVLVHYHAEEDHTPRHCYLEEATALRMDLADAQ